MAYTGLDPRLKEAVYERDRWRCRWCGVVNRNLDPHHIRYRRGPAFDVISNLVSLCRLHHDFVHGAKSPTGRSIVKSIAQDILLEVINSPGLTGAALWRQKQRVWALEGRCLRHGVKKDECLECR